MKSLFLALVLVGCGDSFSSSAFSLKGDGDAVAPDAAEFDAEFQTPDAGTDAPDSREVDAGAGGVLSSGGAPGAGGKSGSGGHPGAGGALGDGGAPGNGGAPSGCTSGDVRCSGAQPQTCINGVWLANGSICSGALPVCLRGVCVECSPGDRSCDGDVQPRSCSSSGAWTLGTECSQEAPQCLDGNCVEICCGSSTAPCVLGAASCQITVGSAGWGSCGVNGCRLGGPCGVVQVEVCSGP